MQCETIEHQKNVFYLVFTDKQYISFLYKSKILYHCQFCKDSDRDRAIEISKSNLEYIYQPYPENGLLSPRGRLWYCDYSNHEDLALYLGYKSCDDMKDWMRLSDGEWYESFKISQKQIDYLWDWHDSYGKNMPSWMLTDERKI